MNKQVLVIGSGGREHALCWKLSQSPQVGAVYCAPGNGGIGEHAECVTLGTDKEIITFCRDKHIDLVVVGPELPLVDGLADTLREAGIVTFGPSAKAAQLEGSKKFTKEICDKYSVPTAAYESFTKAEPAKIYARKQDLPVVIKADGLAAGKGVVIAESYKEAEVAIDEMLGGKFGEAGRTLVIEEFLDGEEVSVFALCDGKEALWFGHAQDHKRVGEGDTGLNTGGMGTYSPAPLMNEALKEEIMSTFIRPTVDGMAKEGAAFNGVLFAGFMVGSRGPKLLEYNVRFGDPEIQTLLRLLDSDLYLLLHAAASGSLTGQEVRFSDQCGMCVVMAAKGYPESYEKGTTIGGLDAAQSQQDVVIFHAGTKRDGETITANGGRVLNVTATADSLEEARAKAYGAIDKIDWPEGFCRRDIAWRALKKAS